MLQNAADSNVNSSTVYEHRREQKMSDEWNWGPVSYTHLTLPTKLEV